MTSINDLLNKHKKSVEKSVEKSNSTNSQTIKPKIKLPTAKAKPTNPNASPFENLKETLSGNSGIKIPSIKETLGVDEIKNEPVQESKIETTQQTGFKNPTLEDISKFVFKEQPENSTIEVTDKFSDMLDTLSESVGSEVPTNLASCLKFIKEHAFLADILKPEHIGTMVAAMRKSYGFIVQVKSEKAVKRTAKKEKEDAILGDLEGLNF